MPRERLTPLALGLDSADVLKTSAGQWGSRLCSLLKLVFFLFVIPVLTISVIHLTLGFPHHEHHMHAPHDGPHGHEPHGGDYLPLQRPEAKGKTLDFSDDDHFHHDHRMVDDDHFHHGHRMADDDHYHYGHPYGPRCCFGLLFGVTHILMFVACTLLYSKEDGETVSTCSIIRDTLRWRTTGRLIILIFVLGCILLGGYIMFIIPGIYLQITLCLAPTALILGGKNMGLFDTLAKSFHLMQHAIASGCCIHIVTPAIIASMLMIGIGGVELVVFLSFVDADEVNPRKLYCLNNFIIQCVFLVTVNPFNIACLVNMYKKLLALDGCYVEQMARPVEGQPQVVIYSNGKEAVMITNPVAGMPTGIPIVTNKAQPALPAFYMTSKEAAPLPPQDRPEEPLFSPTPANL